MARILNLVSYSYKVIQIYGSNSFMDIVILPGCSLDDNLYKKQPLWSCLPLVINLIQTIFFSTPGFCRVMWSSGLILRHWRLIPISCVGLFHELGLLSTFLRLVFAIFTFISCLYVVNVSIWSTLSFSPPTKLVVICCFLILIYFIYVHKG